MSDKKFIIVLIVIILIAGGLLTYKILNPQEINAPTEYVNAELSNLNKDTTLNSDKDTTDISQNNTTIDDNLTEEGEDNDFNAKFTAYEGNEKRSANVRSLVNKVTMSNGGSENKISIEFDGKLYEDNEINSISDKLFATNVYEIKCRYNSDTKLVEKIVINTISQ